MQNPLVLPPLTLAYVGDAVYDLFIRRRMLEQGHIKVNDIHRATVRHVRAAAQANALFGMMDKLSQEEQDVARRGRNAKGHAAPKGSDPKEYSAATAFETLVGFLYLAGREARLQEVLEAAAQSLDGPRKEEVQP